MLWIQVYQCSVYPINIRWYGVIYLLTIHDIAYIDCGGHYSMLGRGFSLIKRTVL